jgi:hypothetical protein
LDKGEEAIKVSEHAYQWNKVAAETAMSNGGRSSTAGASSCAATGEAAAARAVAPTDAVVLEKLDAAKPAYAAARSAPPAPWTGASDWEIAIATRWPADAAACAAAVAPQALDSKEPRIGQDFTGPVQAFTRKPQEQAHAAASGASAGSGAPLPRAIDAVASAFASAVAEAPAANMPIKVNEDVAPPLAEERPRHIPPPFVRPSSCCWCM